MAYGSEDYWMSSNRLLATLMTNIKDALLEGSGLLAKLDALDGTMGGVITLADLNSGQCDMLAKLLGIETSVLTGGDLISKLDALDGTMDGKLDITQLNESSVKTNLDTTIARLDTTITKLTDQLTKITAIDVSTSKSIYLGYFKATTTPTTLMDISSTVFNYLVFIGKTHTSNTDSVIFKMKDGAVIQNTHTLPAGSFIKAKYEPDDSYDIVTVESGSGEQYYTAEFIPT